MNTKIDEKTLREKIRKGLTTIKVQLGLNKTEDTPATLKPSTPSTPSTPATPSSPFTPSADNQYTLEDGTVIVVSGPLAVNSAVQVVTAQGVSPIPDGEYTVRDANGSALTITTVGGSITLVETPTQDKDNTVAMTKSTATPETPSETLTRHEAKLKQHETDIAACKARIGMEGDTAMRQAMARVEKLEAENKAYKQSFVQVVELVEMLAQQPTQAAAERPLNNEWAFKKNKANPLDVLKMLKEVKN